MKITVRRHAISLFAILLFVPQAHAGQAVSAPTKSVTSKNLIAPDFPSDTRKLEAIVDNEVVPSTSPAAAQSPPAPQLVPPAQTILVMPSAAEHPQVVLQPTAEDISPNRASVQETESETSGWYQWTSEPTSVFTAFIALFTFMLALAGGWHVYVAGATARRQLRAYVFITGTEITSVAVQTQPVSQLIIRNTGQTPAHDVMVFGNMVFDEFPLKKDLPVLVFSDPQLTKENLGPGSERYKWDYSLTPMSADQMAKLQAGTHALYVYGEIRYRDVFKKKRYTKYLYYTGGTMGLRGNILGGYPEGNEAI